MQITTTKILQNGRYASKKLEQERKRERNKETWYWLIDRTDNVSVQISCLLFNFLEMFCFIIIIIYRSEKWLCSFCFCVFLWFKTFTTDTLQKYDFIIIVIILLCVSNDNAKVANQQQKIDKLGKKQIINDTFFLCLCFFFVYVRVYVCVCMYVWVKKK